MTTALVLSLVVPVAAGILFSLAKTKRPAVLADVRGIALQTVIVTVVLLVVAGGVAGVLLSRGSDVVSDLEDSELAAVNATTCSSIELVDGLFGSVSGTNCVWTAGANQTYKIPKITCAAIGGDHNDAAGTATAAQTCTVAI